MKKIFISLVLSIFCINLSKAQTGANVVAGAGKVIYNKGELDAEMIIEIISTKREEIKSELAKRLLLDKLTDGSYAFYNYAEKNLHVLLNNSDKNIVAKELLRNSVELAVVHSIAEGFLVHILTKTSRNNEPTVDDQQFYNLFFAQQNGDDIETTSDTSYNSNLNDLKLLDKVVSKGEYAFNLNGLRQQKRYNPDVVYILVDMIFDICKNNSKVLATGLFQSQNYSEEKYKALNKYKVAQNKNDNTYKILQAKYEYINNIISDLFTYYNVLAETANEELKAIPIVGNESISITTYTDIIRTQTYIIKGCLETKNCNNSALENVVEELITICKISDNTPISKLTQIRYSIDHDIIPTILMSSTPENNNQMLVATLSDLGLAIKTKEFNALKTSSTLPSLESQISNFLPIIEIIRNLDDVHTYDKILKFVTRIVDVYGNQQAKAVVEAITTSVERYTMINGNENTLTIDVESLALDIYKKYGNNQRSRFNAMFSVGINYMGKMNKDAYTFVTGSDTISFRQNSFVSEKIGIRINIVDINRKRAFGDFTFGKNQVRDQRRAAKMGMEPLVNNVHFQLYGSGLLYQIKALNSEDKFTKPMVGSGFGMTFFNGLDFSVNYATPAENFQSLKNGFICLSFDVDIAEYLSAARSRNN